MVKFYTWGDGYQEIHLGYLSITPMARNFVIHMKNIKRQYQAEYGGQKEAEL